MAQERKNGHHAREVTIKTTVYEKDTLFFRVEAGTASSEEGDFELSTHAGQGFPIVRLPNGRWVVFDWEALVRAAREAGGG